MRALLLVVVLAGCDARSRLDSAPIRPDPVVKDAATPREPVDAAPIGDPLSRAIDEASRGGFEVQILWYRYSCVDAHGDIQQTCGGKTWSGTPVFGMAGVTFIPAVGFFSAQFQRTKAGVRDQFGVTILDGQVKTQVLRAEALQHVFAPRCSFAEAVEHAKKRGFGVERPFKVVFEGGDAGMRSVFTFIRDDAQIRFDDDCGSQ
jgi:hypothetical protein